MSLWCYACLTVGFPVSYCDKSGPQKTQVQDTTNVRLLDQITPSTKQEQLLTTESYLKIFQHCTELTPVKLYSKANVSQRL